MQSVIKQNFNSGHCIAICGDCPTNESQGELKGDFSCKPRETT
jgi:hypothetical protein